jgi:hypothetical protein
MCTDVSYHHQTYEAMTFDIRGHRRPGFYRDDPEVPTGTRTYITGNRCDEMTEPTQGKGGGGARRP